MDASPLGDSAVFLSTPAEILEGLREVANGSEPGAKVAYLLHRIGVVSSAGLTDSGLALFRTAWILRQTEQAQRALGLALRALTPIQVLEQELLQFGSVPADGVLELLKLHRCVTPDTEVEELRRFFRQFSGTELFVYSNKFKTVRALEPPPDELRAGEQRRLAAMVSPKTPYLNVVRLRRIIRTLSGVVWWADRHFGARALEELAEELSGEQVNEVRIISGTADNVLTDRSMRDFVRFRSEMSNKGIQAEWRVDSGASEWHDRWLGDASGAWNMPPVNNLFKNDYSEMLPTDARPPFEEWWDRSKPRTQ